MLKLKPDSKKSPYGGHHYPEYGVTFKGDNFKQVVDKVRDFRIKNSIPLGDPEQDILCFYAIRWPWLIAVDHDRPDEPAENPQYVAWRDWIQKTWKRPPTRLVTVKEASDRWTICTTCPYNVPFEFKENKESAEVSRRAFLLRKAVDVPEDLTFCDLHKVDLGVFSFLASPKDYSAQNGTESYERCWVYANTTGL